MPELRTQVQRLIDAGVPEHEIGAFIQKHSEGAVEPIKTSGRNLDGMPQQDIFAGLPVGEPAMMGKTMNAPFIPLQMLLRSPGAVTEAGLAEDPSALDRKEASILDIAGIAGRGTEKILPGGFTAEDAGGDITMTPDLRATLAKIAVEQGAMLPYAAGIGKLAGGVGAEFGVIRKTPEYINKIISKEVTSGIEKGVKPSFANVKNANKRARYMNREDALVKDIVENKKDLVFETGGQKIVGEVPKGKQALKQFSQAISQTLKRTFNEFNALKIQAGEKGAILDLKPVADGLRRKFSDKVTKTISKRTARYAEEMADDLESNLFYTPDEAQKALAQANNRLKSYYKNPTYEGSNIASVDAEITYQIRERLDNIINKATGARYKKVRSKYAAAKALEEDVARRVNVDASKSAKGMMDMADVFTGYHAVRGLVGMDPVTLSAAVIAKGIAKRMKVLSDPNRTIAKMFRKAEKLMGKIPPKPSLPKKIIPLPKRIEWKGVIRESGASIPLRKGEQFADYTPPGLLKPKIGGAKSIVPKKLKTSHFPAEKPLPEPKGKLLPSQISRGQLTEERFRSQLISEEVKSSLKKKRKSAKPIIKTTRHKAEKPYPQKEVQLRPDQVATLRKTSFPESKVGIPLMTSAKKFIKSKIPKKLKIEIQKMAETVPMEEIVVSLRPDQKSVLLRRLKPKESKVGISLLKPKSVFEKSKIPSKLKIKKIRRPKR